MSIIAKPDEELHRVGYDSTLRRAAKPDTFAQSRRISQDIQLALRREVQPGARVCSTNGDFG
jgi:hypothetical protein